MATQAEQDKLDQQIEIETNKKYPLRPPPPKEAIAKALRNAIPKSNYDKALEKQDQMDEAMGKVKPKGDDRFF